MTGPLAPGPNSAATRSKALRVVRSDGWAEESCGQVRMPRAGAARVSITTAASSAQASGRRPTRVAQRSISGLPLRVACLAHLARQQPTTGEAAQGGHQGQRGRGDADDGDRGGEAEGVVRRQPGQLQAEQRDQHGRGGEDHRATGGGDRATGGLDLVVAGPQELDEPGDQQQRVVDADTETDHRGHHRGGGADVHRRGEQGDARRSRRRGRPGRPRSAARRRPRSRRPAPGSAARPRCRSARRCRASGAAAVSGRSPPSSTWIPASRVGPTALSSGARFS